MEMAGTDAAVDKLQTDFEEQLLEELLQHFETGVRNSSYMFFSIMHVHVCFLRLTVLDPVFLLVG